jgi:hypothetical protein
VLRAFAATASGQSGGKESADEAAARADCGDIVYVGLSRAGPAQRSVFVPLDGAAARHDHTAAGRNSVLLRAGGNSRSSRACDFPRNSDHASSRPVDAGPGARRAAEQVFSARRIQLSKFAAPARGGAGTARWSEPSAGCTDGRVERYRCWKLAISQGHAPGKHFGQSTVGAAAAGPEHCANRRACECGDCDRSGRRDGSKRPDGCFAACIDDADHFTSYCASNCDGDASDDLDCKRNCERSAANARSAHDPGTH